MMAPLAGVAARRSRALWLSWATLTSALLLPNP